ncbi:MULTISPECIES: hypothetical protein [Kitasatospora]|uniref:Uncharacterized protein n=1 Tax=Kitasatospora cathayae TaxID=3004092 RepID=A0ABY7Q8F5_9ACTN|nr:hypothetical protein [Kitasatospora sp. HUAS 3-15]WBP88968.1 hypothetical protein O1G21_26115 [Kitasatospora sp. HUAS 3-15]
MTSTASHSATPPHRRPVPGDHGGVPGGALRPAPGPEGTLPAGAGPWSVRSVGSGRGRAALELYQHGELADVLVAARLAPQLVRGARRSPSAGRGSHVLAWGRLPADAAVPSVVFTGRRLFRTVRAAAAEVVTVAGLFWLAWAEGPFDAVLVEHPSAGPAERLALQRVRERRAVTVGGAA